VARILLSYGSGNLNIIIRRQCDLLEDTAGAELAGKTGYKIIFIKSDKGGNMKQLVIATLLVLSIISVTACGGGGSSREDPAPQEGGQWNDMVWGQDNWA
jgi:hypothetical protein